MSTEPPRIDLDADGELIEAIETSEVIETEKAKRDLENRLNRHNVIGCWSGVVFTAMILVLGVTGLFMLFLVLGQFGNEEQLRSRAVGLTSEDILISIWETNGEWLIFECFPGYNSELVRISATSLNTGETRQITESHIIRHSLQSRNQTDVLFTVQDDDIVTVYAVQPESNELTAISKINTQISYDSGYRSIRLSAVYHDTSLDPVYSPTDDRFLVRQTGSGRQQIFVGNQDSDVLEKITGEGDVNPFDPVWSSDGDQAAFFIGVSGNNANPYKIRLVELENKTYRDIPLTNNCIPNNPIWLAYDN